MQKKISTAGINKSLDNGSRDSLSSDFSISDWNTPQNRTLIAPKNASRALKKLLLAEQQMKYVILRKSHPDNQWFWNDIIDELFIRQPKELYTKLTRINNTNNTLNLEKAKSFPITDLIEFKYKTARCIFHEERSASLFYYPRTNTVYCFGCHKYADSIDVYQQINNCTFLEAVKKLS